MNKTNKELAVEVAIEMIKANPKIVSSNNVIDRGLTLVNVCGIIQAVYQTLESLDKS